MEIDFDVWKIKDLIKYEEIINPKPQYQRTSVWSPQKKKLLIDSILRGYDIPKFYIRTTPNDNTHKYEVTDGQQRMRAIWEFATNEGYALDRNHINGLETFGLNYNKLKSQYPELYNKFMDFELHISIIKEATPEETRSLFARLQMGERLNPAELRHAIASNIGNAIQAIVETNTFFNKDCRIPNSRYKHQDYLDHVITLVYFKGQRNIKAADLRQLYIELSNSTIDEIQPLLLNTDKVLEIMRKTNSHKKGIFKNKWAFVDTFYLIYFNLDKVENIKPKNFAESFNEFELKRKKYNKEPEKLIDDKASLKYDKDMYDYIIAFKTGGSLKTNLNIRHRVFTSSFMNSDNFNFKK
jgi:hypothetical protein